MAISLVHQLQEQALSSTQTVSNLLRVGQVVASKLEQSELGDWLALELNGYRDEGASSTLPSYRQIRGRVVAWNPYNGWIPVMVKDPNLADGLTQRGIGNPIGELESLITESDGGVLTMAFPPRLQNLLMQASDLPLEPVLQVTTSQFSGILDAVRNKLLSWSLELERAGICGEGVSFSRKEIEAAQQVTYNIGNVGVLGNVGGASRVNIEQDIKIDLGKLADLVPKIEEALGYFDKKNEELIREQINQIRSELNSARPDQNALKGALRSIRSICEGASGNLVASGILAALAGIG